MRPVYRQFPQWHRLFHGRILPENTKVQTRIMAIALRRATDVLTGKEW
jgi:hypothetical protein